MRIAKVKGKPEKHTRSRAVQRIDDDQPAPGGHGVARRSVVSGLLLMRLGVGIGPSFARTSLLPHLQPADYLFVNSGLTNGILASAIPGITQPIAPFTGNVMVRGGALTFPTVPYPGPTGGAVIHVGTYGVTAMSMLIGQMKNAYICSPDGRSGIVFTYAPGFVGNGLNVLYLGGYFTVAGASAGGASNAFPGAGFDSLVLRDAASGPLANADRIFFVSPKPNTVAIFTQRAGATAVVYQMTVDYSSSAYASSYPGLSFGANFGVCGIADQGNLVVPSSLRIKDNEIPPIAISSVVEIQPLKLSNPATGIRQITYAGYTLLTDALELGVYRTDSGAMLQDYVAIPVSSGVFGGQIQFAYASSDKGAPVNVIVRSQIDHSKFVSSPLTLSSADPTALRLGINLANTRATVDYMKYGYYYGSDAVTFDADNFPLNLNGHEAYYVVPADEGTHDYVMLYDGSKARQYYGGDQSSLNAFNLAVRTPTSGNSTVTCQNINDTVTGRVTFTATTMVGDGTIFLSYGGLDPSPNGRMRNVRITRVEKESALVSGALFDADWYAIDKSFNPMRFMDWGSTNGSTVVHWSQRMQPTQRLNWNGYNGYVAGVPYEYQIALVNKQYADGNTGVRAWFNVPVMADDDFITQLITLIMDPVQGLNSNIKFTIEYSNETWNVSGPFVTQYKYCLNQGNNVLNVPGYAGNPIWHGYRSAQMVNIIKSVMGASSFNTRFLGVLASFFGDGGRLAYMLQGVTLANVGSVGSLFKRYAVAPYWGTLLTSKAVPSDRSTVLGWANGGAAGLTAAFNYLEHGVGLSAPYDSVDNVLSTVAAHYALAQAAGLELVAYESGFAFDTIAGNDTDAPILLSFVSAMLADVRFGALQAKFMNGCLKAGMAEMQAFNDVGNITIYGPWGAVRTPAPADLLAPRYQAMLNAATGA